MRRVLFTLFVLFIATSAFAQPYLVCDPQAGVVRYEIANLGLLSSTTIPAQTDGSIKYDIATLAVGTYTIAVRACNDLWGCSVPANFTFSRPAVAAPVNIKLLK